ncbi:MAG: methyltransferase [Pseudomonadota bacterium]|nr:methyltransferase [Pseudomonadota bacterium]
MNSQNDQYLLLGGELSMLSAKGGYRASIDPVILAAAIPAKKGETVLDVGCGVGAAALCLATRAPQIIVTGIDSEFDLIMIAKKIAILNKLEDRCRFFNADLLDSLDQLQPRVFDHVMANPPYNKKNSGNPSPDPYKKTANIEGKAKLSDWISFCFSMVEEGGTVTFIHRYDRASEIVTIMETKAAVSVFPLWSMDGEKKVAKRALVQAIKGTCQETSVKKGLILHTRGGGYSSEANAVLRECKPIII